VKEIISEIGEIGEDRKFEVYKPHLSVARHLTEHKSDTVFEYLNKLPQRRFDLVFDNLAILVQGQDGVWKVEKEFPMVGE